MMGPWYPIKVYVVYGPVCQLNGSAYVLTGLCIVLTGAFSDKEPRALAT